MPDKSAERLGTTLVHRGRVLTIEVDRVRLPHGREVSLDVVRHPASVVLVPMPDADHVILVRQFRHAVDRWLWELPAGSLDPGESPEEAARRECHEEIGRVPGRLVRLSALYPTPGYCDELMIFFRADQLAAPQAAAAIDDDEDLEPRVFSLADVRRMMRQGDIVDMKTVVGVTLIN